MYPSLQISSTSSKNPHDLAGPFSIRLLLKDGITAEAEAETAAHNESKRAGITVGTDNHSLMDAQSEFSVSLPLSPVYRYRMHYGSSIENIENMGKAPHYPDHPTATASAAAPACASFSSDDPVEVQYIQELDKEMAQASIRVTKKRLSKRFHLNLNGCSHPSASTVSSTPSSPVSVVRCKTSRGTYDASNPSTPTTPTSTRSFLSSMPLKSPTFSQLFSTKVAPSRQASPKPFSRPESFHNLQEHPFDDQSDRTEQEQVKERVVSRMRLESALWEIEALLRQYETLVVQDWGLKFDHLYNERRVVRNPQELPA
ncbi:hypothetical protein BGX23_002006 [Mortierella sp. AD031]|nr:hypothetical protein BGX23_002006 [Mortierella sp. AD031]